MDGAIIIIWVLSLACTAVAGFVVGDTIGEKPAAKAEERAIEAEMRAAEAKMRAIEAEEQATEAERRATEAEELPLIHIYGCRLVRVIDHLDERGPIVKVYKRINTPEQEAKVRATIQRVLNEEYTKACAREAALAAG